MNQLIDLADAVRVDIKAEFDADFTPTLSFVPKTAIEDLADLKVTIVPRELATENAGRKHLQETLSVDVGFQKRLSADVAEQNNEIEAVLSKVGEVRDFLFANRRPTEYPDAILIGTEAITAVDVEALDQRRVVTAVLTARYQQIHATS